MGWGVISFICNFLDSFTASHEPTVQLRKTKCMGVVINANASGTLECTGKAVKGEFSVSCYFVINAVAHHNKTTQNPMSYGTSLFVQPMTTCCHVRYVGCSPESYT